MGLGEDRGARCESMFLMVGALTEEQELILNTVRKFVDKEVMPVASAMEHRNEYPHALVGEMRKMGDHVGSGAADCEHDGLGGGLGRRRVKALRFPYGVPPRASLDPAQRYS